MRIIAGSRRGLRLQAPRDERIRPTADFAREALFDILGHGAPPLAGARVLDLFAGTGALGFEALSRGATFVLALETERAALKLLRANAARFGAADAHRVLARDATRLGRADAPFDFALLDPPWDGALVMPALRGLVAGSWLCPGARVVLEQASGTAVPEVEGLMLEQQRRYGAATFIFLRRLPDESV